MPDATSSSATPSLRSVALATPLIALGLWMALGVTGALTGALVHLPAPLLPLVIWMPVAAGVLVYRRRPALRQALMTMGMRPLILFHGIRAIIGASFLVDGARGILPPAFASPAGWGDLLVGLLALPTALAAWRPGTAATEIRHRAVAVWNTLAFADILLAFVSAQRLIFFVHDPRMRAALGSWPYAMVPLLMVPAVLATHLLVFAHLLRSRGPALGEAVKAT